MMITNFLIVLGAVAGVLLFRRNAVSAWAFFCNLAVSVYLTVAAVPLFRDLIRRIGIRNLNPYWEVLFLLVTAVLLMLILSRISRRILPENVRELPLPKIPSWIVSVCFSAISGALTMSCLISLFYVCPVSASLPGVRTTQAGPANRCLSYFTEGMELGLPKRCRRNTDLLSDVFRVYLTPDEIQQMNAAKENAAKKRKSIRRHKRSVKNGEMF